MLRSAADHNKRLAAAACAALVLSVMQHAAGQQRPGRSLAISALPGTCPSPALVARELERIIPGFKAVQGPEVDPSSIDVLLIVEEPGGFRVELSGRARRIDEPLRLCERRAQIGAVSASLLLESQSAPISPPIAAATATMTPSAVTATIRRHYPDVWVAAAARFATGDLLGGPGLLAAGGAVRLGLGSSRWQGTLGIAVDGPATIENADLTLRLLRVPLDASVRLVLLSSNRFEVSIDGGIWFALLHLTSPYRDPLPTNRWDFGPRLAMSARARIAGPLTVTLGVEDDVSLVPTPVGTMHPAATLGTTPRNWLAIELGLGAAFR